MNKVYTRIFFTVFSFCLFQARVSWAASTITVNGKTERPMVVVVCSYNNKDWYKKNLDSIFSQNYSNYKVVYMDARSPDGTGDLVEQYVQERGQTHRVTLVRNKDRKLKTENFYNAVHRYCDDNRIVVDVDGDDWLAHSNVLNVINEAYADQDLWLTYGNYVCCPDQYKSLCKSIPENIIRDSSYRRSAWMTSHLQTFYAWLFKKIKKEDLMYDGKFLEMTSDLAFIFPMLEMAGSRNRVKFITEVLYVHNVKNPISDWRKNSPLQCRLAKVIRNRPPYDKLVSENDC